MYKKFFKRAIDIFGSLMGILVLWWVMIIVAIAVKVDSKGPAIFKGRRVGKGLKEFNCYKFRSMSTVAPKECSAASLDSDAYLTKVGKFIRKTSLDEIPQLFNILKGDMSFVGPRPCLFTEEELVNLRVANGSSEVRPGLTGLAQINGRDITAANVELKAQYDGEYSKDITFIKDAKIFFKTFKVAFCGDDIVEGTKAKEIADKLKEETEQTDINIEGSDEKDNKE